MILMKRFLQEEQGQDLIEYSLLIAFVTLTSAAMFIASGASVNGVWTAANSQLAKGVCNDPMKDKVFCAD